MKTIAELVSLYEDFFKKLSKKLNTDPDNPVVRAEEFETPTDAEIDELAKKLNVFVPEDVRQFWKSLKTVYTAAMFDDGEWEAGWDFIPVNLVVRETPRLQELANNYEDSDPLKKIHKTGVQLTYEEPILLFDGDVKTKKGAVHFMLWDGSPLPDEVAPDFSTFFEHWLAAGCFKVRDFDAYHKVVKSIIPIKIATADNLWLRHFNKQYHSQSASAPVEICIAPDEAYAMGSEGIKLWRAGKQKEAITNFEKAIEAARNVKDVGLMSGTIRNYALLTTEAGRKDEGIKLMKDYLSKYDPNMHPDGRAFTLLGQLLYEDGQLEEGLAMCQRGLEILPQNALGYYTRACAYVRLKKYNETIADIAQAIKLKPELKEDISNDGDFAPLKGMPEFDKALAAN
jgi:tetratricopeptide (TPR) repeat protein